MIQTRMPFLRGWGSSFMLQRTVVRLALQLTMGGGADPEEFYD